MRRVAGAAFALAAFGFAVLPWSAIPGGGFFAFQWLSAYPLTPGAAPALVQLVHGGRWWFVFPHVALLMPLAVIVRPPTGPEARAGMSVPLIAAGALGLLSVLAIALAIDINGWTWPALANVFGALPRRQPGLGYGAFVYSGAMLVLLCQGLALRGFAKGNTFVAASIGASIALVSVFTLYPLVRLFLRAILDAEGNVSFAALSARVASSRVWGVGGGVWNTMELGLFTATSATLLALAFVLVVTRTQFRGRRLIG